ncbi:DUF5008 domain-containing protein [Chitinophaga lutea]|uniref:DUF5008 domain-containing protein n=2 Tax=Chitinophaga lutea TaxID=2488634 RepID=A0A3N4PJZ3_9BACT|nr:DUF5008 domain-containing protein [Chitinophaga lutea]
MQMMRRTIHKGFIGSIAAVALLAACQKESVNSDGGSPYGEPVLPAISFAEERALTPGKGFANDEITIKGKGFLAVKDRLVIQFGGTAGTIVSVTDSTVKVRIPELGSTGAVSAQVGQEFYYGPFFPVLGPLQMDTVYPGFRGANGQILNVMPVPGDKYMIAGSFTEYDNSAIKGGVNRLARINADGTLDRTYTYGENLGPTGGYIRPMVYLPDEKKYLIGGSFSGYDQVTNVHCIAKVNTNGGVDNVSVLRPSGATVATSALAGGFRGGVREIFLQKDGKIMVVGDFKFYVKPNYKLQTVELKTDSMHLDSTAVFQIARLHPDGELDSSYHYDLANHQGKVTVNAPISSAVLLPDDKLLIAGNFTTYGGQPAPHIARLNPDGTLDQSFNPGSGADLVIFDMLVQPDGKIICAGRFTRFNGAKAIGLVRLEANGAIDPTFNVGDGADGYALKINRLPGGELLVAGIFRKFAGVSRNNFVVLTAEGAVHKSYNSNGGITNGFVEQVIPMVGQKAALMVGSFTQFDFRSANRIVKMKYQ